MTQPTIINTVQTIEIDNTGSVVVTNPAVDSNGNSVREIRVLSAVDADYPTPRVVFTLRLSSPTAGNIVITTPTLSF